MPIFGDDHLDSASGSAGPRTGFLEGFTSGYDQQYKVDSELALDLELFERWKENQQRYADLTGEALDSFNPDQLVAYKRQKNGEDLLTREDLGNPITAFFAGATGAAQRSTEDIDAIEVQSAKFRAMGLPGFEELFQEVADLQRKTEERTGIVAATGGLDTTAGQLAGGIAGSFSTRDPMSLTFGLFGGGGRNIATRIANEVMSATGVESVLQFGPVADNRELAGLPEADKLTNILFAAGGSLAFAGLFEGIGTGVRAVGRTAPEVSLDFEDAQLRSFLGESPNSPAARAGIDLLDDQVELEAASPYGTSYPALRRFDAEVAEAEMALLGRTDTAIGRALPDVPLSTLERAADFQIVREQAPEVAARADKAQARVDELDQQLDAVTQEIEGRTLIDAVRLVDEDAAAQLEMLAARDIPEAAKALEAEVILTRVGKERILKATEDAEIAPRKQSQRLRQQRKAANKELRLATRAMEAERAKLNAASAKVKQMLEGESTDLLGYAIATRPMTGSKTSSEVVTAQRARITEGAEELPERVPATIAEDGTVDVGLPSRLPAGFLVPDESGTPRTVADLVADFDEDARLIEAMRSCSL